MDVSPSPSLFPVLVTINLLRRCHPAVVQLPVIVVINSQIVLDLANIDARPHHPVSSLMDVSPAAVKSLEHLSSESIPHDW